MQEVRDPSHHEGSGAAITRRPHRLLEDSHGVVWLLVRDCPVGRVRGVQDLLRFDSITWCPAIALRLLQGTTIPEATGLVLLEGEHRPAWHPEPGVNNPFFSLA